MTRRAGTTSEETRHNLLLAATEEFERNKFSDVSLRHICAQAGVTTGALYFFFKNKDDLFAHVIQPLTDEVIEIVHGYAESEDEEIDFSNLQNHEELGIVRDVYTRFAENRQLGLIVVNNSTHPAVIAFDEELRRGIELYAHHVLNQHFDAAALPPAYGDDTFEWMCRLFASGARVAVQYGTESDRAMRQVRVMSRFLLGGIKAISGMSTEECAAV